MESITLAQLLEAVGGGLLGDFDDLSAPILRVDTDSRSIHPGSLFIPLTGARFDGHAYIDSALKGGAAGCLTAREREGGAEILVQDHGRGIPREELDKVCQPFYMVDKSRSRKAGGAGLGLALCRRIVELHGGELEIESEPGRGTRVRVLWKGGEELPCETGKTGSSPS